MQPIYHCLYDELVAIEDLRAHPKNRNQHPVEQLKRLAEILSYQGWRAPVKVSKRSGFITAGHGRLEAARMNSWPVVPVNYQDYESDEQEYADVQADNAIAGWSQLDFSAINFDLSELGPDFNIDHLGIKNFLLEPADKFINTDLWVDHFEKPTDDMKIIVIFKTELEKNQILEQLNVKKMTKYQNGKLISIRWSERFDE